MKAITSMSVMVALALAVSESSALAVPSEVQSTLNPFEQCIQDGIDWAEISSNLYCTLSQELGGLGDTPPWFTRKTNSLCAYLFQTACDDVFQYGATEGSHPLSARVLSLLEKQGVDPSGYLQQGCAPYTQDPFATVFEHSVYIDCSYDVPPKP